MAELLMAIDIGNTSTHCGLFSLKNLEHTPPPLKSFRVPTAKIKEKYFYKRNLPKKWGSHFKSVKAAIVSSVVPDLNLKLKKSLKEIGISRVEFVSAKNSGCIQVKTQNPQEVGSDRIVNARAAMEYGPRSWIVVDFGTAATFDCVKGPAYLGGIIAPGPVISAEALYQKCAQLPFVPFNKPNQIIGKTTLTSIQSGLFHGYRGMVLEIVKVLKNKMGPQTGVLVTGGQSRWLLKGLPGLKRYIPDLTLRGLYLIFRDGENKFDH